MKIAAKDVKNLQRWGEENPVVKNMIKKGTQPDIFQAGVYWPSGANWAWCIGIAKIGKNYYELLTRFGAVEGGRAIYMPKYNLSGERAK